MVDRLMDEPLAEEIAAMISEDCAGMDEHGNVVERVIGARGTAYRILSIPLIAAALRASKDQTND